MKWQWTVNTPALDAVISIENGEVKVVPATSGRSIDQQATLNQIVLDPKMLLDQGELQLVMRVDKPYLEDLSGLAEEVETVLAREFSRNPEFLLVSQPTRGLDVGAIEYIHSQILKMRDLNVAILLISLELEEIFALSDRILVLYEGRIVKEFLPEETNEREVGLYMTGGKGENYANV